MAYDMVQIIITAAPGVDSSVGSRGGIGPGGVPLGTVPATPVAGAPVGVAGAGATRPPIVTPVSEPAKRTQRKAREKANKAQSQSRDLAATQPVAGQPVNQDWHKQVVPVGRRIGIGPVGIGYESKSSIIVRGVRWGEEVIRDAEDAYSYPSEWGGKKHKGNKQPQPTPQKEGNAAREGAKGGFPKRRTPAIDRLLGRDSSRPTAGARSSGKIHQYSKSAVVRGLEMSGVRGAGRILSSNPAMTGIGVAMMVSDLMGDKANEELDKLAKTEKEFFREASSKSDKERQMMFGERARKMQENMESRDFYSGLARGAVYGSVVGMAIGSFLGPVGTMVGGAIGSVVGAVIGGITSLVGGSSERMAELANLTQKQYTARQVVFEGRASIKREDSVYMAHIGDSFNQEKQRAMISPVSTGRVGVGYARLQAKIINDAQGLESLVKMLAQTTVQVPGRAYDAMMARV